MSRSRCFRTTALGALLSGLALAPSLAIAQDVIVLPHPRRPAPPAVHTKLAQVSTEIRDGVATTTLRQVLHNDGGTVAEADWMLPIEGAAVDRFTMTMNGQVVEAEVLDSNKAREVYEAIVRRMRDPGLLEYAGQGCLRARVFPIPPGGDVEVTVRFTQVLEATAGLHRFAFPLRVLGLSGKAPDRLGVDVQIHSKRPIKSVFSPLAGIDVVRKDDHEARASLELDGARMPERDFELFYGVDDGAFGLDLLTWRASPSQDGHFLLMVTPRHEWPDPAGTVRVVQFVLDTSGSMQGEKIEQARRALRFFVESLRPTDRFNIVPFSTEARPFFAQPVAADAEHRADALDRIAKIEARGGTNIEEALGFALRNALPTDVAQGATLVPITVFLTDGLPTIGRTDPKELLQGFTAANQAGARVFVFGVGQDVNTKLLDTIAQDHGGDRDYVRAGEDLEIKTSALFDKLSHPVMTDVALVFDGIDAHELEPKALGDLFRGSRILIAGRYRGDGHHAIRLRGKVNGEQKEFVYEATFPKVADQFDFVPVLWAKRRIGTLLDAIRLNGQNPELVAEVQRLGKEYGLVTPYTSHLIVEEGMQIAQWRGVLPPARPATGDDAFAAFGDNESVERAVRELARGGAVAPTDATPAPAQLGRGLREEGRRARDRLEDLPAAEASGAEAVDRSVLTLALTRAAPGAQSTEAQGSAARLVVHRIGDRVFHLVGGAWIDRDYRPEMKGTERRIVAFSDDWFALSREHPELAKVLAFSTHLVVIVDGAPIEIVEPTE
ncbi:MAG: VWA domain-containing protein [Planctomycetes bacterium]|nr:VWA domain-containing protein [Planctomycetota bacterium]